VLQQYFPLFRCRDDVVGAPVNEIGSPVMSVLPDGRLKFNGNEFSLVISKTDLRADSPLGLRVKFPH